MFKIKVTEAAAMPELDFLYIKGSEHSGSAKIGDVITDGSAEYKITSIPIGRKPGGGRIGEVDICVTPNDGNLVGKTLYSV
jgi:hypothetical protein